jgi:hypothetical protein
VAVVLAAVVLLKLPPKLLEMAVALEVVIQNFLLQQVI